jgi:L-lysine 2,3-aminomutase
MARLSGYLVPKLVREVAGDPGKRPLSVRLSAAGLSGTGPLSQSRSGIERLHDVP